MSQNCMYSVFIIDGPSTDLTSDYTGNHTKLPKILLNGNNICMVCTKSNF